jgi:ubiquinone/menaquinone biosynthesis C-methylase UbiE/type 1 glutamine amidotransferase
VCHQTLTNKDGIMKSTHLTTASVLATLLLASYCGLPCSQTAAAAQQESPRQHHFRPEQFEHPERAEYQKPDEVVPRLKLKPGDVVADIGAGSGYFSRRFARAVGPDGRVFAVDIDPNMLHYIQQDAGIRGLHNIVPVLAAEDDPGLATNSVDAIFICDTIHHIQGRADYCRHLMRALRPGGRFVIVDFFKRELPIGPPPAIKIAQGDMIHEVTATGYFDLVEQDSKLLPYQYLLNFQVAPKKLASMETSRQVKYLIAQGVSRDRLETSLDLPPRDGAEIYSLREYAHHLRALDAQAWQPLLSAENLTRLYDAYTAPLHWSAHGTAPRALALVGDRYHEPAHIEIGLNKAFQSAGIDLTTTVDVRHLTAENLRQVDLFVILRDGMNWPDGQDKPYVQWMTDKQQQAIADFVKGGGGFLGLHNCTGIYPPDGPYYEVLAGQYHSHSPIEVFDVEVADPDHPITRGVTNYRIHDEDHWPTYDASRAQLLLRSRSEQGEYPAGWAYEYGKGRVCYLANGHTAEAIEHPMFQRLMAGAIKWCLHQEVSN